MDNREILIKNFIENKRPPEEIREKFDFGYSLEKNVLEIFEIRMIDYETEQKIHSPFVKCRFIKKSNLWKIYWRRASGKWESYVPHPEERDTLTMLEMIFADQYACFFG